MLFSCVVKLVSIFHPQVAVHLDCYCSFRNSAGPWYCELCDDKLHGGLGIPAANLWDKEKPCFVAECGLCGGTTGAFRKSTDGQWVHAVCAEVLEVFPNICCNVFSFVF